MKGELLILFVIILLALILCCFLGTTYYGREGMDNMSSGQVYYGPNGNSAQIQTDADGKSSLTVTNSDGSTSTYSAAGSPSETSTTYSGPNGGTALVQMGSDGSTTLTVTQPNGTIHTYKTMATDTTSSTSSTTMPTTSTTSTTSTTMPSTTYDNYDHYNGTAYPTVFYGPNGGTARVIQTDNNGTLVTTSSNGTTQVYYISPSSTDPNVKSYYGPNGGSAKIVMDSNGKTAVEVTLPDGTKVVYYSDNVSAQSSQDATMNQYNPETVSTGSDYNSAFSSSSFYGPNGGQLNTLTGPSGNTYAAYDSSAYYNSLPQGIPKSLIPPGQEDLYILKSQIVPPVCPVCPEPVVIQGDNDVTKCPPCEPCGRCAEPNFECKKVPNYKAFNPDTMPVPVLSDFSSFGM